MRRLMKLFSVLLSLLLVLVLILVGRGLSTESLQIVVDPVPRPSLDSENVVERLRGAIAIPTVSQDAGGPAPETLAEFHLYLESAFPAVHEAMSREVLGGSLLFTWAGTDSSLPPAVLTGHFDVVPEGDASLWTHPAFAGVVVEGFIWGRGTLDDKIGVLGLLEAAEHLITNSVRPERTIYLAFGHDEEVGGLNGAKKMAALLAERGVEPEFVLDEGMVIMSEGLPGLDRPVALVGIAEKGAVTLELTTRGAGGHSSMPARGGAVARLARALDRLEKEPLPTHFEGPAEQFFRYVAPEMSFKSRLALTNRWILGPIVERELSRAPGTDALLRTTTALTIVQAGVKNNVLPTEAMARVNFRIHPSDNVDSVEAQVRQIIDDPEIEIKRLDPGEPSPVAPTDQGGFRRIETTIRETFPETMVAPMLVLGMTDARHYGDLTPQVFRFAPLKVGSGDLKRVHGIDERIGVEDYLDAVAFYIRLIEGL